MQMQETALSTAQVDYIQGIGARLGPVAAGESWTLVPPALRRLSIIRAVGTPVKQAPADTRRNGSAVPDEAFLIGAHGYRVPIAYLVRGDRSGISLHLGTWEAESGNAPEPAIMITRQDLLLTALRSLFPLVQAEPAAMGFDDLSQFQRVSLVVGIPGVPDARDEPESEAPLDRLTRAMGDSTWAFLVLAQPADESWVASLRKNVINEMRSVQAAEKAQLVPSPLGQHYNDLLSVVLKSLTVGHSVGMWRTAVYLFGDNSSIYRLGAAWQATFDTERSVPEPIRVVDLSGWPGHDRQLVQAWAMPDSVPPPGPGTYQRPMEYQSLLHSLHLGRYIHLPRQETPGFALRLVPSFDVVSGDRGDGPSIEVGRIIHRTLPTDTSYRVRTANLVKHVFVAGVTGAGKTNSLFQILSEAASQDIPFLVLEPAKTEYRALLADPRLGSRLRVFTPGNEQISPFRLNPFEVPTGTSVSQHFDLLRAVFGASFGMWAPLPQVLERCLQEVYTDRGWDLAANKNARLDDGEATASFPTLSELVAKAREVVPALGYEERVARDIEAALVTRLQSLCRGGKGYMLDVRHSIPIGELLAQPCVLELDWMGDDDDKSFLMALLLARIVEHRRAEGRSDHLRHLLVVEEAHRLLSAVPGRAPEDQADPRGKAVETFTQLLAEVRAYGQGVIIADQVPVRLAPEVIKNTGLKLAHRTVAADDRMTLAGAMAMDEQQARSLTILGVGEAAALGEGDDAPLLVRVSRVHASEPPSDDVVTSHMSAWRRSMPRLFDVSGCCAETCAGAPDACQAARWLLTEKPVRAAFARAVLSAIQEPGALDRLWSDVTDVLAARLPPGVQNEDLLRSFAGHASEWFAGRRGVQAGWTYRRTAELSVQLRKVLLAKLAESESGSESGTDAMEAFRRSARELHARFHPPYPGCDIICRPTDSPLCLYRHAVADLVASGRHLRAWQRASEHDSTSADHRRTQTWEVCQDAGYDVIEFPEEDCPEGIRSQVTAGARRACLCFAQQMLAADEGMVPRTARRVLARILQESGL